MIDISNGLRYNFDGEFMLTIKNTTKNEICINKSKFIGILFKVESIEEIENILNNLRVEYKDCNHICYGYILDEIKKANDDGEPSGTAGLPILNVLEGNHLNHVLGVVIRYFGGIKLGTGGLIRAYRKCCNNCVKLSDIVELIDGYEIELMFNYDQVKFIDNLFLIEEIVMKSFEKKVVFKVQVSIDKFNNLKNLFEVKNIDYSIKKTLLVTQ